MWLFCQGLLEKFVNKKKTKFLHKGACINMYDKFRHCLTLIYPLSAIG